eukprot:1188685-Rhodomonas_salina.6
MLIATASLHEMPAQCRFTPETLRRIPKSRATSCSSASRGARQIVLGSLSISQMSCIRGCCGETASLFDFTDV